MWFEDSFDAFVLSVFFTKLLSLYIMANRHDFAQTIKTIAISKSKWLCEEKQSMVKHTHKNMYIIKKQKKHAHRM